MMTCVEAENVLTTLESWRIVAHQSYLQLYYSAWCMNTMCENLKSYLDLTTSTTFESCC